VKEEKRNHMAPSLPSISFLKKSSSTTFVLSVLLGAMAVGAAFAWINGFYILALAWWVIGLLVFLRRPHWAVLAIILFDWIEVGIVFLVLPVTLTKATTAIGILILLHLLIRRTDKTQKSWGILDTLVVLLLLVTLISAFYSNTFSLESRGVVRLIGFVVLYFVVSRLITNIEQMRLVIYFSVFAGLILIAYTILEFDARLEGLDIRFGQNSLAAQTAVAGTLSVVALRFSQKRMHTLLLTGYSLLYFVSLLLSSSRGGLLAFAGASLLAVLFLRLEAKNYLRLLTLPVIGFLALQLIPGLADLGSIGRFMHTNLEGERRADIWFSAFHLVRDNMALGIGYGQFQREIGDYAVLAGYKRAAAEVDGHSMYVTTAAETGLIGFLIFVMLLVLAIWLPLRLIRRGFSRSDPVQKVVSIAVPFAVLTQSIHGFFNDHHFAPLLWILLGLSQSLLLMYQSQQPRNTTDQTSGFAAPAVSSPGN
jgi:exopolysaccharide production protein ExoQ